MNIFSSILKRKVTTLFFILAYTIAILTFSIGNSAVTSQKVKADNFNVDNNKILKFKQDKDVNSNELLELTKDNKISVILMTQYNENDIVLKTELKSDGLYYKPDMVKGEFFTKEDYKKNEYYGVFSSVVKNETESFNIKYTNETNEIESVEIKCKGITYDREPYIIIDNNTFFKYVGNDVVSNSIISVIINGEKSEVDKAIENIREKLNVEYFGYSIDDKSYEGEVLYTASFFIIFITIINSISIASLWVEDRKKEIVLRKVIGAKNIDIFKLFFGELTIISLMSAVLALFIQFTLSIMTKGHIFGVDLNLHFNNFIYSGLLAIGIAYGSALPAFKYLSKIQPVEMLREE